MISHHLPVLSRRCCSSILAMTLAALACTSCANPSHLFIYQHSNFGFNAGTSPQSGNIHIGIGLRRDFACIIPKVQVPREGATPAPTEAVPNPTPKQEFDIKAASSFVSSRVRTRNPFQVPDIAEVIATGSAATNLGDAQDALSPFVTPPKKP